MSYFFFLKISNFFLLLFCVLFGALNSPTWSNPPPGHYYEKLDVEIESVSFPFSQTCIEMARDEAVVFKDSAYGVGARNLASARIEVTVIKDSMIVSKESYDFIASYRKYRTAKGFSKTIPNKIFVSYERTEFLKRFEGLPVLEESNPLADFKAAADEFQKLNSAWSSKPPGASAQEEIDKFSAYLGQVFSLKDKWSKICQKEEESEKEGNHLDDSERQIVDDFQKQYSTVLEEILLKHSPQADTTLIVTPFIHTRMDPCPFCMNRLLLYFTKDFPRQTISVLNHMKLTKGVDFMSGANKLHKLYLFPFVSSRSEYKYGGLSIRAILPWKVALEIPKFEVTVPEVFDDTADDLGDSLSEIIFYAVPYLSLQQALTTP